jgi:hypothetical protein
MEILSWTSQSNVSYRKRNGMKKKYTLLVRAQHIYFPSLLVLKLNRTNLKKLILAFGITMRGGCKLAQRINRLFTWILKNSVLG